MRDRLDEFPADTAVAVITFGQPDYVKQYVEQHEPGFPVLIDPTRSVYTDYGLERGSVLRVWGWKAAKRWLEILRNQRSFRGLATPTEDTLQLGGDFIIDRDGILQYSFWGEGPDDRPSIGELVAAMTELTSS